MAGSSSRSLTWFFLRFPFFFFWEVGGGRGEVEREGVTGRRSVWFVYVYKGEREKGRERGRGGRKEEGGGGGNTYIILARFRNKAGFAITWPRARGGVLVLCLILIFLSVGLSKGFFFSLLSLSLVLWGFERKTKQIPTAMFIFCPKGRGAFLGCGG